MRFPNSVRTSAAHVLPVLDELFCPLGPKLDREKNDFFIPLWPLALAARDYESIPPFGHVMDVPFCLIRCTWLFC